MPSSARSLAAVAALSLLTLLPARADVVLMKDGRILEGQVVERPGGKLSIVSRFGEVELRRADVLEVRRQPTADELYAAQRDQVDLDDPDAVERLALWAREQGMSGRARDLEARAEALRARRAAARREAEAAERRARAEAEAAARAAALRQRRLALGAGDAEGLYALARWAEGEAYPASDVERLLREALLADPQLARARVALELRAQQEAARGARQSAEADRREAGRELSEARATTRRAEAAEREALAHQARLRAQETDLQARHDAVARRERQVEADAARALADRQAAQAERWEAERERAQVRDQLVALEREQAALCAERERLQRERRDLECQRDQLRRSAPRGGLPIPTGVALCPRCGHVTR